MISHLASWLSLLSDDTRLVIGLGTRLVLGLGDVLELEIDGNSLNHSNSQHREISVTANFVSYDNDIQWHHYLIRYYFK